MCKLQKLKFSTMTKKMRWCLETDGVDLNVQRRQCNAGTSAYVP